MNTAPIHKYIESVAKRYATGISREHSYRSDLEILITELISGIDVTNEPSNVTDCGNPDYVLTKGKIPIGYIEAKDVGKDLNSKSYKEQFTRYKNALDNLIITDYCWFQFFDDGVLIHEVRIAEIKENKVIPLPNQYESFAILLKNFCEFIGQTIKSPKKLAEMMASKAKLLQDILQRATTSDEEIEANTTLRDQFKAFKDILIHDLTPKQFADVYAQTLAYGMFSARYQDDTMEDFSRQEAAELIPKSNPFLRKLFGYIAGPDIDERLIPTVNNLADIFRATDVAEILKDYGKSTAQNDPIVHFYETFLGEYDKKLKKSRGVWYTPDPVVKFIVRAVDDILKTEFGLKDGLADNSKVEIEVNSQNEDARTNTGYKKEKKLVHKVQVLDPATGTGTFLAETIKHIYHSRFQSMQGAWEGYVDNDLIPRLNGFEILMASYAMAHLKLDLVLKETGYTKETKERFRVYLTNSLEEHHPDTGTLFANWLSSEANEANHIKRDSPVMVVMGNPPYSGESANKGKWIMDLMEDYKKEPGGKEKLKERNPKWINDDYVKFMRYGQHFIEKNGSGVLAFINPHGFLDNPTFRGVRWNLLKTYDKLYTIDLHGNSKKKETAPDGSKDENVFDIQQGVSINLLIKTGRKKNDELGEVYHVDQYGLRESKYQFLLDNSFLATPYNKVHPRKPFFLLRRSDKSKEHSFSNGFSCKDLFLIKGNGMTTAHDEFVINQSQEILLQQFLDFQNSPRDKAFLHNAFDVKEKSGWNILEGYDRIKDEGDLSQYIEPISYRPFDDKFIFYEDKLVWRTVKKVMDNYRLNKNVGLIIGRQGHVVGSMQWNLVFAITQMTDFNFYYRGGGVSFPLYLYADSSMNIDQRIIPNLKLEIVKHIAENIDLPFASEHTLGLTSKGDRVVDNFTPIDILDYIYAVLHSPSYREKYKEFLKIDFPRIPYPDDAATFRSLVALGGQIRELHLLESAHIDDFITSYPQPGDNTVTRKMTKTSIGYESTSDTHGRVWINDDQYFDNVPLIAWDFYIGGYQPAQKWLKDRKGRTLSYDDILHYQRIIVALSETDRLMKEIDEIWEV
ncbi:MAG: N-6 DNA methylase [Saprospiraceae bacterium]|nr:N-6 DNA methylase [Saprospiraceae bacterium]